MTSPIATARFDAHDRLVKQLYPNTRMTKITLLILILVAAILPIAIAQQPTDPQLGLRGAEPTIRSEPTVLIPSESENPEYPAPGKPLVTPKPQAEMSPSPLPTATTAVTRSPSPSPTSRASTSPAAPTVKKSAQAALRELENKWAAATAAHDIAAVQALLAGDYVGVTAAGNPVNKAGLLAELRKDKNTYESVVNSKLDVRVHGTTAIIVGTTKQKGKDAAGKAFSFTYRWTDTWMERDGKWQCVASQSIRLAG